MIRHAIALAAILALAACAPESPQPAGGAGSTMDIIMEETSTPAQSAAPEVEVPASAPAVEAEMPASAPASGDAASMMPEPDLETTIGAPATVSDQEIQAAQEQMEQTREALGEQMQQGMREAEEAVPAAEPQG